MPMEMCAALLVAVGCSAVDCMVKSFMLKTIAHLIFQFGVVTE